MAFEKLVRYEDGGKISYGNLLESSKDGFKVAPLTGNLTEGFKAAESNPVQVKKVRSVLIPIIPPRC